MKTFAIFAGLFFCCTVGFRPLATAQDLPLPKFIAPLPTVAYARVTESGEFHLWLLKATSGTQKSTVVVYKEEKKIVNGETISEKSRLRNW